MTKTVETSITARVPPGKRVIFKRLQARYGPFTFDSLRNMMYEEDCSPNHSTDLNLKTILIVSLSATLMFLLLCVTLYFGYQRCRLFSRRTIYDSFE